MTRHEWDKDGERCVKCGDKDWFAGPECGADTPPETIVEEQVTTSPAD